MRRYALYRRLMTTRIRVNRRGTHRDGQGWSHLAKVIASAAALAAGLAIQLNQLPAAHPGMCPFWVGGIRIGWRAVLHSANPIEVHSAPIPYPGRTAAPPRVGIE